MPDFEWGRIEWVVNADLVPGAVPRDPPAEVRDPAPADRPEPGAAAAPPLARLTPVRRQHWKMLGVATFVVAL